MGSSISKSITLSMENGVNNIFNMHENGLCFFNTNDSDLFIKNKSQLTDYSFLETVVGNKKHFQRRKSNEWMPLGKHKGSYSTLARKP